MLVYQDSKAATRKTPPPGLDGAADLFQREDRDGSKRFWGIGNAHLVGPRDDFIDLDDGWAVAAVGKVDPQDFRRTIRWCRTVDVVDTNVRTWTAPVILSERGERVILVAYGRDFLPMLTAAQDRAVAIAKAAREQLEAAQEIDGAGIDFTLGARWTAELLALTHHIGMEALAALGLIDQALILSVLSAATGLRLKVSEV